MWFLLSARSQQPPFCREQTSWGSPQRPSQHYTHSSSKNSLAQTRTKEFPAPFPYPSLQLDGKCSIPVVLSPGRTCNEFHAEKEEMVHITMLGLDQSRYSFKWQERLPFHGNMVVTLLPIIIWRNIINITKIKQKKGRDTTFWGGKIWNVCGLFHHAYRGEKERKQHQNSTSASSQEATLSALLRAASWCSPPHLHTYR